MLLLALDYDMVNVLNSESLQEAWGGERLLPYVGYIAMCSPNLAYGGWARSTIGSQNFGVLTKQYDNSLFLNS